MQQSSMLYRHSTRKLGLQRLQPKKQINRGLGVNCLTLFTCIQSIWCNTQSFLHLWFIHPYIYPLCFVVTSIPLFFHDYRTFSGHKDLYLRVNRRVTAAKCAGVLEEGR